MRCRIGFSVTAEVPDHDAQAEEGGQGVMGGVERFAGESLGAMLEHFLTAGPPPHGVSSEAWAADHHKMKVIMDLLADKMMPVEKTMSREEYIRATQDGGETWIYPSQTTQQQRGGASLNWQYPFPRSELVKTGYLSGGNPEGGARKISLPEGVSVFDAIASGVIR